MAMRRLPKNGAHGPSNSTGRKSGRGDLLEEWLKEMMTGAVNQHDIRVA